MNPDHPQKPRPDVTKARNRRILLKFCFDRCLFHKYYAPPMFDERLPVHIDPIRFAETGRELQGRVSFSEMERLSAMLMESDGEAQVELSFGVDHEGIRFMQGRITADVVIQCQRCLGPLSLSISAELMLGVVSERDPRELPSYYEPLPVGHEPIFLRDIIEDELILSLPIVPKHAEGQCPNELRAEAGDDEKDSGGVAEGNPFAALAGLKRK